jgi:hypothetical protein
MYEIVRHCTNAQDFNLVFTIDDEEGDAQDITDFTFEFTLNDAYGVGLYNEDSDGVTVTKDLDENTVTVTVLERVLSGMDPGSYRMACRYVDDEDRTKQVFVGTLMVHEGEFA